MPVTQTVRAHVVTAALTYRGHELQIDERARIAYVIDRDTGLPILELHEVEWSMPDRENWRVAGVTPEGAATVWKASRACARCGTYAVYPTPEYDMPT